MGDNSFGYYKQGKIYLNYDKLLEDNACYEAVDTVLHESRHAFQDHSISNNLEQKVSSISHDDLNKWKINLNGGYLRQGLDYFMQPTERDAFSYALSETEKVYSQLESIYGKNSGYKKYKKISDRKLKMTNYMLRLGYGKNYLQTVEDKVYKKYVLMQEVAKEFPEKQIRYLNDPVEDFVHKTHRKEVVFNDFKEYLPQYLKEKGFKDLEKYINQEELKGSYKNYYREIKIHETILPPPLSRERKLIETLEQAHEKLTHLRKQIDPLGGTEINQRLNEKLQDFNKKVQAEF
ncbi:hypothetical protein [Hazenella coriacea]|uniref:Uncharacterized protein n=1 Tax=Hazenella coriacea TaxID=1179467 RepID=A0A4R3L5Y2_9BACL|nr:hypothetical protein [Hazenella coriacea]TCS94812.1 hypothetical protein EDD58_103234 [Hazenella coriacea]